MFCNYAFYVIGGLYPAIVLILRHSTWIWWCLSFHRWLCAVAPYELLLNWLILRSFQTSQWNSLFGRFYASSALRIYKIYPRSFIHMQMGTNLFKFGEWSTRNAIRQISLKTCSECRINNNFCANSTLAVYFLNDFIIRPCYFLHFWYNDSCLCLHSSA